MNARAKSKTVGRPRSFDTDEVLDKALEVFWREGYEGASLHDLSRAMGINRPSIYSAFGDKETLFRKALDRYVSGPAAYVLASLRNPSARAGVKELLEGAARGLADPRHPRGCLLVQGALSCSRESAAIQRELSSRRDLTRAALWDRLKQAKRKGELPSDSNPGALARYFAAVLHGMAVQAAGGARQKDLMLVAAAAMRAWPERKAAPSRKR